MPAASQEITNHQLTWARWQSSPNHGGLLIKPTLLVIHYTAGFTLEGAVATLCDPQSQLPAVERKRRSAHLVSGRKGEMVQLVKFNTVAWHAGASKWKDRADVNFFGIGIEIDNPGWLLRNKTGQWAPKEAPKHIYADADVIKAKHKSGGPELGWLKYTAEQMISLTKAAQAIIAAYPTITEVVGHEDIVVPGRKMDPGPAFPMADFRSKLFPAASANV
jgi:N-acetylmuramoyl-L-alanine amidase